VTTPEEPTDRPEPTGPAYLPQDPAYGAGHAAAPPPPYGPPPAYGPYGGQPYGGQPYGGYGAPYGATGYPPALYGQNGITSNEDTTWAMLGYLGQFLISFVAPLVVYLARKDQSPFCRFHGAQGLNHAITSFIVIFVGFVLGIVTLGFGFIITLPVMMVYGIAGLVYLIIAATKANQGEMYRIPKWLVWPIIK
jgi:uncharacterized protein